MDKILNSFQMNDRNPEYIWLFCGYAGSGKDVAGSILEGLLENTNVWKTSFANQPKQEVSALYSIPLELLNTQEGKQSWITLSDGTQKQVRTLLIEYAQGKKQETGNPYIWAEYLNSPKPAKHWILTDWRFLGELECLQHRFPNSNIITLRIIKPDVIPLKNETEHELDSYVCNFSLSNSGSLLYLATQLNEILTTVLGI